MIREVVIPECQLRPAVHRALLGGLFSLALVMAPLAVVVDATGPAGAASPHTVRPFLAQSPRTFPPAVATYTVNTTNDTADATPGNGVCADSAGQCSIRAAIEEANADGVTTNINVPAGCYTLTMGPLTLSDSGGVQLIGAGSATTTITGTSGDLLMDVVHTPDTSGSFVQLTNITLHGNAAEDIDIEDGNDTVILSGSTVTAGTAAEGGGVFNDGQLWATSTAFTSNTATDGAGDEGGGAIFNDDGSVRLNGDSFTSNTESGTSTNDGGGALYNVDGPVAIDNSSFTSNSVTNSTDDALGGALLADDSTELTGDSFTGNTATGTGTDDKGLGGAVFNEYGLNQVSGTTFTGNSVSSLHSDTEGGAFYDGSDGGFSEGGGANITQSTFVGNVANNGDGGALSNEGPGMTLSSDTFSRNSATSSTTDEGFGGGVYSDDAANITATLISGNHADEQGGGLWEDDGQIVLQLAHLRQHRQPGRRRLRRLDLPGHQHGHRRQRRVRCGQRRRWHLPARHRRRREPGRLPSGDRGRQRRRQRSGLRHRERRGLDRRGHAGQQHGRVQPDPGRRRAGLRTRRNRGRAPARLGRWQRGG